MIFFIIIPVKLLKKLKIEYYKVRDDTKSKVKVLEKKVPISVQYTFEVEGYTNLEPTLWFHGHSKSIIKQTSPMCWMFTSKHH